MALAVAVAVQVVTLWVMAQMAVAQVAQEMEVLMEALDNLELLELAAAVAEPITEHVLELVEAELV